MNKDIKKFIECGLWISAIFVIIRLFIAWADIIIMVQELKIGELCYNIYGYIGEGITAAIILLSIFNKWAWKWKVFRRLHNVPVLEKDYHGVIKSDYNNTEKEARMTVHQTFSSISVKIKTDESSSNSLTAAFYEINDERKLIYTYLNVPNGNIQVSMPMHFGTTSLDVEDTTNLSGNYYTGRKTNGFMQFTSANIDERSPVHQSDH